MPKLLFAIRLCLILILGFILLGCGDAPQTPLETSQPTTEAPDSPTPTIQTETVTPIATEAPTELPTETQVANPTATAPDAILSDATTDPTILPTETLAVVATPTSISNEPIAFAGDIDTASPILLDSEKGRLYATGILEGERKTLVLSADDGQVIAVYDFAGALALDTVNSRLYVDRDAFTPAEDVSLKVFDADTGVLQNAIPLMDTYMLAPPQADLATGHVLAFREEQAYMIDPEQGEIIRTLSFEPPQKIGCSGPESGPSPISGSVFDPDQRILYVAFITYNCPPGISYAYVAYDMNTETELGRGSAYSPQTALARQGYLYESTFIWPRNMPSGSGTRAIWQAGVPKSVSSGWGDSGQRLVLDTTRGQVYEATENSLLVFDAETMALHLDLPRPITGSLVNYDPKTDQLFFVTDGQLHGWPASNIKVPVSKPPVIATPPASPVQAVYVSPNWGEDQTVIGLWQDQTEMMSLSEQGCLVFGQTGGDFYFSRNGGQKWFKPKAGLQGGCLYLTTLAFSPNYASDQTLFAARVGRGVVKSLDGGYLWQAANANLTELGLQSLFISPDYASDQTLFAHASYGDLYRSSDGGQHWQAIATSLFSLAISPEFNSDQTLMGVAYVDNLPQSIQVSPDGGQTWQEVSRTPSNLQYTFLSLAPEFARWQVAFAYGTDGILYRSEDGGRTWGDVLTIGTGSDAILHLVYAPDIEVNRPLFLLSRPHANAMEGLLYRSLDGGLTWAKITLTDGRVPSALAISPTFAQDDLLFVGTVSGAILTLNADRLLEAN